ESLGYTHKKSPANKSNMVMVAQRNAPFSFLVSCSILGWSFSSISTFVPLFNRGSTILSVMYHPTRITTNEEVAVNHQLFKGFTCMAGSKICAADCVKPCKSGSMPDGIGLALNPPETPAKAAAIPANGCLPAAI